MKVLIGLFIFIVAGCNISVNTVDPQSSRNMLTSKKDGFFIAEYKLDTSYSRVVDINEVWVEQSWKNQANYAEKSKVKTGDNQLNVSIKKFDDDSLIHEKYFIDWEMEVPGVGIVGYSNGLYTLFVPGVPDVVQVDIKQGHVGRGFVKTKSFRLRLCDSTKIPVRPQ